MAHAPRLVVAGMSGDAGKTLASLAVVLGARDRRLHVRTFKKGPDYIDASWLTWASAAPARNLDTFLVSRAGVKQSFARHAARCAGPEVAAFNLIEGNRGLFDGTDAQGTHSTAALAELLDAPVLLVLDVRKMTGTAAALVRGCQALAPNLALGGVILNRVASGRHETVAREAIESACGVSVLGAIPQLDDADLLPGRHLGLVTPHEHLATEHLADSLRAIARANLDLDRILECAGAAPALGDMVSAAEMPAAPVVSAQPVTIGYLSDSAFNFYYPENLEALETLGARLAPLSSLSGDPLPATLDALYIGGGFPETHAARLSGNHALLDSLRARAADGLPIYAECGGLMLLANTVTWQGVRHKMSGVLPVDVEVLPRPQGHGYVVLSVDRPNPFFKTGREIYAHEFHYSRIVGELPKTACAVLRGTGCGGGRDALVTRNVWASYAHVHAAGLPEWAAGMLAAARRKPAVRRRGDRS
jgi:cobyrinic acid a,c-diamide synthase